MLVDMTVGIDEVAPAEDLGRALARVGAGATVADLVAAAMRQREAASRARRRWRAQRRGRSKLLGDEMDHLALALDAAAHRHHARRTG